MILRKILKILHEVSAAGLIGSIASCLIISLRTPTLPLSHYIATRHEILEMSRWIMMPSMAVALISGLLAMAATPAYLDVAWVWIKAALGISVFEGTLVLVGHASQQLAKLSDLESGAEYSPVELSAAISAERNTLWLVLGVALVNVVLAVWRPRPRLRA